MVVAWRVWMFALPIVFVGMFGKESLLLVVIIALGERLESARPTKRLMGKEEWNMKSFRKRKKTREIFTLGQLVLTSFLTFICCDTFNAAF